MKTEKRKPYETPSVGVVESTCAVIAGSTTVEAPSGDDNQLENGVWDGLDN